MLELSSPVSALRMVGPAYLNRLARLNIKSIQDLLLHIPARYENYANLVNINTLQAGETVTIKGKIVKFDNIFTRTGKKIQKLFVSDETGSVIVIFFNQTYLSRILLPEISVSLSGKVSFYLNRLALIAPQFEIIDPSFQYTHTGRIVPVYPETEGLSSKWLRVRLATILNKLNINIPEFLPGELISRYDLLGEKEAIYKAHYPGSDEEAKKARRRLAFDELLMVQLAGLIKRSERENLKSEKKISSEKFRRELIQFLDKLPFKLTRAQQKALEEIQSDLNNATPMNRLLQGDVGSGKTIVALITAYLAYLNGFSTLFMAPTEILAKQHFRTIERFLKDTGMKTALVTSKDKPKAHLGKYDILIGTHALLFAVSKLKNLALVIIDEQQRFGVMQRANLKQKGDNPHLLSMTATPIPRTIALSLYADLNLSVIDELPQNRLPVKTWVVPTHKRAAAYQWIARQIPGEKSKKNQAFIICPLIEESESLLSLKSVKKEYERLKKEVFPRLKLGLLHGKLESRQKDKVIKLFLNGVYDILVATPVVEVGIDIPSAVIMMIEGADRFGLSQLHQLRGRVGRSDIQSYCLLFTENDSEEINQRLKILENESIGIRIAERDLRLRGPGQFFGLKQHGDLGLKIASLSDLDLIKKAGQTAKELITDDISLKRFPLLREKLEKYTIQLVATD